ncbi:MAG: hypothetical protein R3F54_02955 [Alphaproteobacteria bacterium]
MTLSVTAAKRALALDLIEKAFAERRPPAVMSDSKQLSDVEHDEVMSFQELDWREVGFDLVERSADAVFWFSPEAFCYYLPGLLAAGIRAGRTDSNAYDALVGMLDRSPEPDYWDDFFRPRWTLLTSEEIDAVSAWIDWLALKAPDLAGGDVRTRLQDTLTLLRWTREGII